MPDALQQHFKNIEVCLLSTSDDVLAWAAPRVHTVAKLASAEGVLPAPSEYARHVCDLLGMCCLLLGSEYVSYNET